MRSLPTEVGRTSLAGSEIVTWMWQNPDGSSVTGVFRNGFLVSKAQVGLLPDSEYRETDCRAFREQREKSVIHN